MQLSLNENIKKYRKEMNLTQEDLAEAFGVTIGAVSKWESGSTIPDIMTMVELADFFNISVDVLLGYSLSSKNIDDISHRLLDLTRDQKFDEAVSEAEKALVRYPASFKITVSCASVYAIVYTVTAKDEDAIKSISLYEKALTLLSQNDDPDYSEFSIRMDMARLKSDIDPDGALSEFNKINYLGIADIDVARLMHKKGETDEALDRFTKAMFIFLIRDYELSMNMSLAIASRGTKKDFKDACALIERSIAYSDSLSLGKICYITKMKVILLAIKAMALSCLTEYEKMKSTLDEAYELAKRYDADPNNSFGDRLRFWYAKEDYKPFASDDLGQSAVESVDKLFVSKPYPAQMILAKKTGAAGEYWKSIRK